MSDAVHAPCLPPPAAPAWVEAARVGLRLAQRLRAEAGAQAESRWGPVLGFLEAQSVRAEAAAIAALPQPLDALQQTLNLSDDERSLLLLAGLPEAHEGCGAAFAALHPRSESRPSWGLFCWLICADGDRACADALLHGSPLFRLGLVRLTGDAPLPERSLRLCEGLWSALHGHRAALVGLQAQHVPAGVMDADDWPRQPATQQALAQMRSGAPALVALRGLQPAALRLRAQQLAAATASPWFELAAEFDDLALTALLAQSLVLQTTPVLMLAAAPTPAQVARLGTHPGAIVLAGPVSASLAPVERALCVLDAPPLAPAAQARLWQRALPELAPHGPQLAARYAIGPDTALQLRADLAPWLSRGEVPPLARCVAALKARSARSDETFARRIEPVATWSDLVLPPDRMATLRSAVQRMQWQQRVLDEWGFGARQHSARGLRLLFSGLPGTGKTLAAEVVAHALHADLLVVDLARMVSKWVGETEKNLAAAFDQAEGSGAVLFFDEADALFGKRTEVGDAHDRYANIESAYLLARLERFDGVAILATNLRANLDAAFLRRFELALPFGEPGPAERAALWRAQFPPAAPLADDLDFDELAALHALPGALIRNAALGAAFLAAAEGTPITRTQVDRALRQEYEKTGRAAPT